MATALQLRDTGAESRTPFPEAYFPDPAPSDAAFSPREGRSVQLDRETIASAIVGTGGAWLLGSAILQGRSGCWNAVQRRGLWYAGIGFLLSAVVARWLQHLGNRGIAVSLVGTMLAMRGMYLLVKERAAKRAAGKPRTPE